MEAVGNVGWIEGREEGVAFGIRSMMFGLEVWLMMHC